jgi:hypothetical protein
MKGSFFKNSRKVNNFGIIFQVYPVFEVFKKEKNLLVKKGHFNKTISCGNTC